jgi:CheY-like chemotaxis protein
MDCAHVACWSDCAAACGLGCWDERRPTTQISRSDQGPAALVVDDDTGIRELIGELLESEGYTVELASDGQRALERMRDSACRMVVLLDVMMPMLNGIQILEIVAADESLARRHGFVVMTASALGQSDSLLSLARQFNAPVLTKPFSIETLLRSISDVANRLRD